MNPNRIEEAWKHFELDSTQKTLLVVGGSLGARTVNESVLKGLKKLKEHGIQLIWQVGGYYYDEMVERVGDAHTGIVLRDFIRQMDFAYAIADVVISRAGALSIAELMLTGKPAVLVPSSNVAEDHQTINALALTENEAALMVKDSKAEEEMIDAAIALIKDEKEKEKLSKNIRSMAHENAAIDIANQVIKLIA